MVPNNVTTPPLEPTATPGTLVEVPNNPTNPAIPSNLQTGTFKVEVKFPGAGAGADMKELVGSDLPYNSHTLKATITGKAITTAIVEESNDPGLSPCQVYPVTTTVFPFQVYLKELLLLHLLQAY